MDREALEHSLVRRLLDHIEHHTTDMADEVYEVPAEVYTSRAHLDKEVEVLFLSSPILLCLSASLPRPGTYTTVDLCGTPVLVTRGSDGRVRAMVNMCRHRGVRVADGAGETRRLTCPFHGWTYDLEGDAGRRPDGGRVRGDVPRGQGPGRARGRGEARAGGGPAPAGTPRRRRRVSRPGPERRARRARLRRLGALRRTPLHRVGANWKVTLDTFRENYHFDHLHRNTLKGVRLRRACSPSTRSGGTCATARRSGRSTS